MKTVFCLWFIFVCQLAFGDPLPEPWYQSGLEQYESGIVKVEGEAVQFYGYLKSRREKVRGDGSVLQNISPPEDWLGKRVKLTAKLKPSISFGIGYLFMSIRGNYERVFDYMDGRQLRGVGDWQEYSIVLDVPSEPYADILFGITLRGKGELLFDDFKFEIVGYDVPVTGRVKEKNKKSGPSNLGFETVEPK